MEAVIFFKILAPFGQAQNNGQIMLPDSFG